MDSNCSRCCDSNSCIWNNRDSNYTSVPVIHQIIYNQQTLSDIQSSTQLVKDYKVLVTSLPVVEQVVKQLDLDISPDALVGKISCEIETDSRVLQVTVTDTDPQRAKEIVDAIADVSAKQITSVMQIEAVNVIEYGRVANAQVLMLRRIQCLVQ